MREEQIRICRTEWQRGSPHLAGFKRRSGVPSSTERRQRAKEVVSYSPGLVDFAIGLVNSVINLPDGQVKFFEESKLQRNCEINLLIKTFLGLVELMFGPVNVNFSLPK